MSKVQCFLIEKTTTAQESLRRYANSDAVGACSLPYGYHNARTVIGGVPWLDPDTHGRGADDFPHDDSRWPARCACGYTFQPTDQWQHNLNLLFGRVGTSATLFPLREAPPGAMYDAPWYHLFGKGPDGQHLCVVLPDRTVWQIDGPANNGPGWKREGAPPNITATPSIKTSGYHGHLVNGVLESCPDSST